MNVSLLIAAGGQSRRFLKGRRARWKFSKLFVSLDGKPLLAHALESFEGLPQIREIVIAVPRGTETWIRARILNGHGHPPVRIVRGGKTRTESVRNALLKTSARNSWVLVHDGARPFPPREEIRKMLRRPSSADGVILARPVVPTLKKTAPSGEILGTVDRTGLFEAETPQLVKRSVLLKAYRQNPAALKTTDESSLVESIGGKMKIQIHTGWNVKVTTAEDLQFAQMHYAARHCETAGCTTRHGASAAPLGGGGRSNLDTQRLLRRPLGPPRNDGKNIAVGFGRDTHRLVAGRKLYLGGVCIPSKKGALGHSDGDALLHAASDAILGALGAGDIGDWFSDQNPRYKNIRSEKILKKVLGEARKKDWQPAHLDSVIVLEKPRLGPYKKEIRQKMARLLELTEDSVSIKAKTQEGLGPEGQGLAVTCEAIVLMRRSA